MILVVILILCALFAVWSSTRPRRPSPPVYPGALPLIGHVHLLNRDLTHIWNFEKAVCRYSLENGGVVEIRFGLHSLYIITDPTDGLVVANTCLDKPYYYSFAKKAYNNGLLTADASTWKSHRKLLNPSFNLQVLNTFVEEYNVQARNLVSQLASEAGKDPFDVRQYLINFALKTVSRTSLGLKTADQNIIDKDYAHATEEIMSTFVERTVKLWLHLSVIFNRSSLKRKHDELMKIIKSIMDVVIHKRKSELKANVDLADDSSRSGKFKSLLDQLLESADKQKTFTDDDIRNHLDTIVLGTFDTTAAALTFALILIGTYRDVQDRVYKELQEVLGDKDNDLDKYDLPKLVYLEAVLKETLRLYPSAPMFARRAHMDVKLKNHTLPAGSSCVLGLYGINRHPMWGADAEQFKPERWLDPANLPDNPWAFASFGIGRRNCIGKQYGMMLMKTALAHVLRRYYVTADISNVVVQCDIVLKPISGHHISLKIRE